MEYVFAIFVFDALFNGGSLIIWIKNKVDEGIDEIKEGRKMKRLKQKQED